MKKEKILAIVVILMILGAALWGTLAPPLIPAFNLVLLAGLIGVTTVYAYSTIQQANASVKMAEEMREQLLVMNKPNIVLELIKITPEKHLIGRVVNDSGRGPAINTEIYIDHPLFKFNKVRYTWAISVGKAKGLDFHMEKPSTKVDPKIAAASVGVIVANYEDVSGNKWHSTLELQWDKGFKPGHLKAGISGHYKGKAKMSEKQTSRGTQFKRFIETIALAATFLAGSLTLGYVIYSGHLVCWQNILLILVAVFFFLTFLFFTVALCKTKLIDCYDKIFEPSPKRRFWPILFVWGLWIAIGIGFIAGLAPLFNVIPEGWRLPTSIFAIVLWVYVIIAMVKTLFFRKKKGK